MTSYIPEIGDRFFIQFLNGDQSYKEVIFEAQEITATRIIADALNGWMTKSDPRTVFMIQNTVFERATERAIELLVKPDAKTA